MECSVLIEAKFVLRRRGRGNFCIVEKCRKFSKAFFFGRDVMFWLAKAVEDCLKFLGNRAPYQTKREGNRFFLIQRCQNSFSKFIKLVEFGTGNGKGINANLEGKNGTRWDVFVKKLKGFVCSSSFVFALENRGASFNDVNFKASKSVEARTFNSLSRDLPIVSYLSALKAPI